MDVTDATFKAEVEDSKGAVLVDFHATWCGPCKMLAPMLEEIGKDMGEKMRIVKIDVDENSESASKTGVRAIPCLVMFKDGKEVDRNVGAMPKADLQKWIDAAIAPKP